MYNRHDPRLALGALIVAATVLAGSSAAFAADSSPLDATVGRDRTVIATAVGDPRLTLAEPQPSLDFDVLLGEVTHRSDETAPFDPSDQQRNQVHGLIPEPGDGVPLRALFR
jgi:hypothetical protein